MRTLVALQNYLHSTLANSPNATDFAAQYADPLLNRTNLIYEYYYDY